MFDEEQIEFHGLIFSTVFGSSFDGVIEPSAALRVLHRVLEGLISAKLRTPAELVVADTTGYGAPTQVSQVFTELNRLLPTTTLTAHFHDTRGTGMANVLAALEKEVRSFETSLGGLGGCPFEPGAAGNVPTEDVAYLCEREGLSTGYNFAAAKKAFDWFESATGVKLGGKYGRVGK
jgi:hydroxymethylglutaryl-CoA lyase